jgi:hypothetical protein
MLSLLRLALASPQSSQAPAVPPAARAIRYQVELAAPPAEVWRLWTTPAGLAEWLAPSTVVELAPLGRFEVHFSPDSPAGQRGAEGNPFLAVQAPELFGRLSTVVTAGRGRRLRVAQTLERLPRTLPTLRGGPRRNARAFWLDKEDWSANAPRNRVRGPNSNSPWTPRNGVGTCATERPLFDDVFEQKDRSCD